MAARRAAAVRSGVVEAAAAHGDGQRLVGMAATGRREA